MVFAKDDLAVIVACFTKEGWTGTRTAKEISKQEVIGNLAEVERIIVSHKNTFTADVGILLNGWRPRFFSTRCTDLSDTPMIRAA